LFNHVIITYSFPSNFPLQLGHHFLLASLQSSIWIKHAAQNMCGVALLHAHLNIHTLRVNAKFWVPADAFLHGEQQGKWAFWGQKMVASLESKSASQHV